MLTEESRRIKGLYSIIMMLAFMLLITAYMQVEPVYAQFDFNAYLGAPILNEEIDGIIESEWDDAGHHPDISLDPQGTAEIWTKHDGTFLYIAMKFMADSSNPWVGFQFERTSHMSSGVDGAIFGHDRIGPNEYRDIFFGGFGKITTDSIQNGVGAISVDNSNLVTVELKKPLSSEDSVGNDIEWTPANTYALIIRWDSDGGGSSGGTTNHLSGYLGGSVRERTIFLNLDEIPEFTSLTLFVLIIAFTIIFLIIKKRLPLKTSKNPYTN
jgi:hypothetical protein